MGVLLQIAGKIKNCLRRGQHFGKKKTPCWVKFPKYCIATLDPFSTLKFLLMGKNVIPEHEKNNMSTSH